MIKSADETPQSDARSEEDRLKSEQHEPAEDGGKPIHSDEMSGENAQSGGEDVPPRDEGGDDLPEWEPLTPELVEDEAIRGDFVLRWAVVLLAFLLALTDIAETATLVHVKAGQYMAAHGWFPPRTDVFSYTATADERSWINLSWLFDLTAAGVFAIGGAAGLTVLKALLATVTFGLVVHINRSGVSTWWGSILAGLVLLASSPQFTARPELVTLLGIALTLWLLHRWKMERQVMSLWMLVPVFLVWSNLDPRMFLGLALLLLYAGGEAVGYLAGRPGLDDAGRRKQLWLVTAACFVAALLNPFGWHSLAAPFTLYATEYPALRAYAPILDESRPSIATLQHYPMAAGVFWKWLNYHSIAGLVLAGAALGSFVLNHRRLDWGHLFAGLGFLGFAMAGSHELAAAGIVFAVLATLNAQDWYRETFRQSYSVETSELLFSRGGRAATVLAFAVVAFLAISGRLEGPDGRRTGFGFHPRLQANIEGLREDLEEAFDDKPFNFLFEQGDVLIWIDRQCFIDSRVALYGGSGENDLLARHDRTRRALRKQRPSQKFSGEREYWRETFDRFGVTHVIPRLSGPRPDYITYTDLLTSDDWELTRLGAVVAVFYRSDVDDSQLQAYLAEHRINFVEQAFQQEGAELPPRTEWPRRRSAYQNFLSLPRTIVPNEIQTAQHYQMLLQEAAQGRLRIPSPLGAAWAHLAIQKANEGLAHNPHNAEGYRLLGNAYEFLGNLEAQIAQAGGGASQQWRRYYQTVQAYNQSLVIEPNHALTHLKLAEVYAGHQKFDLALRALDRYEESIAEYADLTREERRRQQHTVQLRRQLNQSLGRVTSEVERRLAQDADRLAMADFAYNNGCVLHALDVLNDDPELLSQNPAAQLLRATLLLEAGHAEEALNLLDSLEQIARPHAQLQWHSRTAWASLANADYRRAVELWTDEREALEMQQTIILMQSLPLVAPPHAWPLQQIQTAITSLYQLPYQTGERRLQVALCHLEAGRNEAATAVFRQVLETSPETSLRPLVRFYLYELTGELIDLEPPSDWIPVTPDLFAPEKDAEVKDEE